MISVVICDFDGVLVESVDVKTQAFAKLFDNQPEDIIRKIIAYHEENGGVSRYEKFKYFYKHFLKKPLDDKTLMKLGAKFSDIVLEEVINAPYVKGAKETLEFLYKEIPLFVASGTPHDELLTIISERKMGKYFKGVFGSPKAKSLIITQVIREEKVMPENVVMVGDAMSDYRSAVETGVNFVGRERNGSNIFTGLDIHKINDLTGLKSLISRIK